MSGDGANCKLAKNIFYFNTKQDISNDVPAPGGEYRLDLPHFASVSHEAKDLISKLILLKPEARLAASLGGCQLR